MTNQVGQVDQTNSESVADDWYAANQHYLTAALGHVRTCLEARLQQTEPQSAADESASLPALAAAMSAPPALETLCTNFGLSHFERDLLLLCAGLELDSAFAPLYAAAQNDPQRAYPTFSLALATLPNAHWSALTPHAPLRRWRLIEVGAGSTLTASPLRIDEPVLHYLVGAHYLDERLASLVEPLAAVDKLVASQVHLAEQMANLWSRSTDFTVLPVVQLCGPENAAKRAITADACARLGLNLYSMAAQFLPTDPHELEALVRLWEREASLSRAALLLDCDELDASDAPRTQTVMRLIERVGGVLIITGRERRRMHSRPIISLEVAKPSSAEQRMLWQDALGATAPNLNGQVDKLIAQFSLSAPAIYTAAFAVTDRLAKVQQDAGDRQEENPTSLASVQIQNQLWDACRVQSRPRLDDLAQRVTSQASWEELVLPEMQLQTLHEIGAHVRQRATVYEQWGFAAKGARGLGISALFTGNSGTGKTLAAEVLANELRIDLYRIDLSQVVSKYIGETEKNLRRVFDAAEEGSAMLLFDEADALFGKRSEVKDSHDRYANIEVSYLLQRMEAYRGLAILTTNMKNALDPAFLRRIRFIVHFPFPDAAQRAEIWRRIFPAATPIEHLDATRLARLNVAGGNIRNIALNGAFLAADAGEPVRMVHLLRAAQIEYAKLEKPLTENEIGGWV
ncbi:ATP-binding protein [soil metagenome]